jgi:membrane protease YdiL (CAAX protease family)
MGGRRRAGGALRRERQLVTAGIAQLSQARPRPVHGWQAVAVSVAVAAWGNAVVVAGRVSGQPEWVTLVVNPVGAAVAIGYMRRSGWTVNALGLRRPRFDASPAPKLATAAALAWAAGWVVAGVAGVREISGLRLARLVVGTALAEELLHRGVLPAVWSATGRPSRVVVVANMASFGLWHFAGAIHGGRFHPLEVAGPALVAVALMWARMRTGSVLSPATLHLAGNITGLGAVTPA